MPEWCNKRGVSTVPARCKSEEAFAIASGFDGTVYNGLYVALALTSKTHFVTTDERLANGLAAPLR